MKAMIFAAGEGTRLRPLTAHRPKALVEVGGRPMLARVLEAVKRAGITDVVVNVHYLAGQITDWLDKHDFGLNITVSDESARLLDTGGGLLAARRWLDGSEPILLHNADICTDLDLDRLSLRGDATLLVSDRKSSRRLVFSPDDMRLCGWVNESDGRTKGRTDGLRRAFSGIHLVSPAIFPALERYAAAIGSDVFSLTPFYVARASSLRIYGTVLTGYRWHDIGDIEKLAAANADFA